ncbi:MAG: response regulator [Bradyrhizobium sp.]|nr:response regulator [Bradyrhizobium sp.]
MAKFVTLLVEDDDVQRAVLVDLLKNEGFEVIECSTAEAAELVVATSGAEMRAVVFDQRLDGAMLGSELAAFAREMFPRLNIIVISGYEAPCLPVNAKFLRKPFPPSMLLEAVRGAPPGSAT